MRKKGIPGLERIRAAEAKEKQKKPAFIKRYWGFFTTAAVALGWILTNITTVAESPTKIVNLKDQLLAWYYEDAEWTGTWSDDVEGFIDERPVTDTQSYLRLAAVHGEVGGEISTKQLCRNLPIFDFVMFEGSMRFGKVHGVAFDYFGGERKNLFAFTMTRTKNGIEIAPTRDPNKLMPDRMVITKVSTDSDSSGMSARGSQEKYCEKEREELWGKVLRKDGPQERKRVDELRYRGG
ncbi:hypothetical protein [Herbaspirillum huttiense]|uniref:DUF1579 domain-containing protein n=1 Tax=Herbaspirillum huttiense subsp. lycopersici TaxID=3074428 RepID=A0ABU2EPT4_9BURK|nr:hypothetical protein [Herbaspirillum huttiense]MDR9850184.1 hypothetical protein [Herbaspirillum huttiense SE1]